MSIKTTLSQARSMTANCPVPVDPVVLIFPTNLEDIPRQKVKTSWDEDVRQLKELLSQNQYKDAVLFGDKARLERGIDSYVGGVCSTTAHEFDVNYAKALIYTGETEKAIVVLEEIITEMECGRNPLEVASQSNPHALEERRRNLVLGLAHNHLGYLCWMNLSHYRLALREFRAALPYFVTSNWQEEYANTCDNMGRVYALLHQHSLAQYWIDKGLRIRRELKDEYRIALSLTSQAIAYLLAGELCRAHQSSAEALGIFEKLGAQRGIGLACITRGHLLRLLADSDSGYSHEQRMTLLERAATYLKQAIKIFEQQVVEPVRRIEASSELGRVYGNQADLIRRRDPDSRLAAHKHSDAVQYLKAAIKLADKEDQTLLAVDSCADMARVHLLNGELDAAERYLQSAEGAIPDEYKIGQDASLRDLPLEECVEGLWNQMSKIERLRGGITCSHALSSERPIAHEVLAQATQHYSLATGYFKHYSDQT